ncbi:MAG: PfkB family carbohydrate kinase, partial [Firmicutes bacterium]|nr:PfkB family carbohydrate kinase [Bacillota bacterium]
MLRSRLEALLARMRQQHLLVVGDGCLDMYWRADMQRSVLSRETPHFPLPVVEEQYSLGAGSNVAQNLAALGCTVTMVTVVGQDWRGQVWMECAQRKGIETGGVIVDPTRWTPAYGKPIRVGIDDQSQEDPRLDFTNRSALSQATEAEVIHQLQYWARHADAVIVTDQVANGVITEGVREALGTMGLARPTYVDSRDCGVRYRNAVVKPNTVEFAQALTLVPETVLQADEAQLYQWAKPWIARVDGAICLT